MTKLRPYVDGWFGPERELTVIPRPKFPFITNPIPDAYSRTYDRDYLVPPLTFIPKVGIRYAWTNLLLRSEEIDNATWTKTNASVTANAGTAPDGQTTLDKILETGASGEHSVSQAATVTNVPHEASVFAVGGLTRRWIRLSFTDSAATTFSAFFDVLSGSVTGVSAGVTPKIVSLGLGQFHCTIRFTPAAGAGTFAVNVATDASTVSYAGNTSNGVNLWGAQVAAGVDVPYISTTTAARAVSAPERDKLDPMAYLIREEDPVPQTSETEMIRRLFARVPRQQIVPGSLYVTKPTIPGTFPQVFGSSLMTQPDPSIANYVQYTNQAITADSGPSSGTLVGGHFTLTYGANTTAPIAYNANAATVQTELNAIASISIGDGVTVTGDPSSGFTVTFVPHALPSADTTNITGGTVSTTIVDNGVVGMQLLVAISVPVANTIGGTFTLTFFGQTTAAIAYNAAIGTVQAAINALSEVSDRGGVTVLGSGSNPTINAAQNSIWFRVSYNAYSLLSGSGTGLFPAGSSVAVTSSNPLKDVQNVVFNVGTVFQRTFTSTAHNITTADDIIVKIGEGYYTIAAGLFTVPDANTIGISATAGEAFTAAGTATIVGKRFGQPYTAGTKLTRCNRVTDFYLPGVTPGISSADDIPLPEYQGDPASLLEAIFAADTSINYEVGDLQQWMDSPILMRTITTLNASTL